jgi:hypothetical protein
MAQTRIILGLPAVIVKRLFATYLAIIFSSLRNFFETRSVMEDT